MAKKKPQTRLKFSDQLRQAIDDCEVSRYRISQDLGISQSMLSRFMSGERGMSIKAMDVLMEYLNLEIVSRAK